MATTNRVLVDGSRNLHVLCTADSDDETTAATKVDRDGTSHGATAGGSVHVNPGRTLDVLAIEEIYYSIDGYDNVTVKWNFNAGQETAIVLGQGEGYIEFDGGVLVPATSRSATASDGDILFQTGDAAAAGNYSIKIRFRKKWA